MAKITLNGVDALTESGGVVTIPAAADLNLGTGAVPTAAIQDDAVTSAKLDTNIAVGGTLGVTGATTLTGAATLSSTLGVTGAATLSSTLAVTGNATFTGDLTVNGTTTTINTQTVEIEDNILQLNTTQASPDTATAATSGISVYRGDGVTQASLIFDDADDTWDLTNNIVVAGNIETSTTSKVKQKGAFMQSSTHQALTLGG